jgi:hypothetical protein
MQHVYDDQCTHHQYQLRSCGDVERWGQTVPSIPVGICVYMLVYIITVTMGTICPHYTTYGNVTLALPG